MYICIYTHIYIHIHTYIYIYTYTYIHTSCLSNYQLSTIAKTTMSYIAEILDSAMFLVI